MGPSGAGKPTTQRILIGLLEGYGGRAEVMGKEVREWGPELYERIGVSFELPNHHQRLTALENLQHFGALYQGPLVDPLEALRWVDLEEHTAPHRPAESEGADSVGLLRVFCCCDETRKKLVSTVPTRTPQCSCAVAPSNNATVSSSGIRRSDNNASASVAAASSAFAVVTIHCTRGSVARNVLINSRATSGG